MTNADLITNLVVALGAGLIGALVATRLRQSVILGYILAGVVIGPFTPGFVADASTVEALADLGIIFLMFAIGMQLSLGDLARVGRIALVGGSIQVLAMMGIGFLVGIALGWSPIEATFFGAVISNSSSTVLSKALGERGQIESPHGRIALAWSSVQDFGTIIMVVVLSAIVVGSDNLMIDLPIALGKAVVFLGITVPLGSRYIPKLFQRIALVGNRELFIVSVAAVALGTAYAASLFGISLALGAFVAGIVVSESDLSHQIFGDVAPLRDIFAGLFFVSVGMLVNPVFLWENLGILIITVVLIVIVKGAMSAGITYIAGYSIRTSILNGTALAQSAEFSFLLARLGASLAAITAATFSLLLAAAAVSIVLIPTLVGLASSLVTRIENRWPSTRREPAGSSSDSTVGRGHAVLCGYGPVGRTVGTALRRRGFPMIVIEEDPRAVRRLREDGVSALVGSVSNPTLLNEAKVAQARIVVIAHSDPLVTREVVSRVQAVNRRAHIIARAASRRERDYLLSQGVAEVVLAEAEVGLEMARHTLHRFGVSSMENHAIVHALRVRMDEGNPVA